jgi:predicted RNase H-like nuclease
VSQGGRIIAGVDGCKAGWFAVWGDGGANWTFGLFTDAESLWRELSSAKVILIDIPIGLPSDGPRVCDVEARRLLGGRRGSSVFPAPCRKALSAKSYDEAKAANRKVLGKAISAQCWGICPKILEIDCLLQSDERIRTVVREGHPEICFWALAGHVPMHYRKSSNEGGEERLNVLRQKWPSAASILDRAMDCYLRKEVGRDDILDAVVMYLTACSPSASLQTIPNKLRIDDTGLPMEMVYST